MPELDPTLFATNNERDFEAVFIEIIYTKNSTAIDLEKGEQLRIYRRAGRLKAKASS